MNCLFCNKPLSKAQIYEYERGKSKGTCSRKCGGLLHNYGNINNLPKYNDDKRILYLKTCIVCKNKFETTVKSQGCCNQKCGGVLTSIRMTLKNPMINKETRLKVSKTLKKIKHKPKIQGGNGRGNTKYQELLLNKLNKIDNSFLTEFIFKTKEYNKDKIYPYHYKIDIASELHKIAIEIDGLSHRCLKIKECDKKKEKLLSLAGWKVLRFTNSQIQKELEICVQMVMSMI